MATQTLRIRVEMLEDQMEELRHLPSRVSELGAQFSHFQADVRGEFSALRADIAEIRAELRRAPGNRRSRRSLPPSGPK
jgi:hypothetical protein